VEGNVIPYRIKAADAALARRAAGAGHHALTDWRPFYGAVAACAIDARPLDARRWELGIADGVLAADGRGKPPAAWQRARGAAPPTKFCDGRAAAAR
jgi:hypothetical protein